MVIHHRVKSCRYDNVLRLFSRDRAEYGHHIGRSIGYGYVRHPEGERVTPAWLRAGDYSIEIKGTHFPATFHAKTPFDPENLRIKGIYDFSESTTVDERLRL